MSERNGVDVNRLVSVDLGGDAKLRLELSVEGKYGEFCWINKSYAHGYSDEDAYQEFDLKKAVELRDALDAFISANDKEYHK